MKGFLTYMWLGGAILYTFNTLAYWQLAGPEGQVSELTEEPPRALSSWGSYLEPHSGTPSAPSSALKAAVEPGVRQEPYIADPASTAVSELVSPTELQNTSEATASDPPSSAVSGLKASRNQVESFTQQAAVSDPPVSAVKEIGPFGAADGATQKATVTDLPASAVGLVDASGINLDSLPHPAPVSDLPASTISDLPASTMIEMGPTQHEDATQKAMALTVAALTKGVSAVARNARAGLAAQVLAESTGEISLPRLTQTKRETTHFPRVAEASKPTPVKRADKSTNRTGQGLFRFAPGF